MKNRYIHLIGISILLILIALFYPVGLGITTPSQSYYNDTICFGCNEPQDPLIEILLIILIPIIALIGIILLFIKPKKKE